MTDFEDLYRHLLATDQSVRKQWLLDHQSTSVSAAHWWLALIDSAVSDVRHEQQGRPRTRPRADLDLAAALIDWALEQNFPIDIAVGNLVQLTTAGLAAGRRPDLLPANVRPDSIAGQALRKFGFTRPRAMARAAELRAKPITDDDYVKPGENVAESFRLLSGTDDYQDYHRLLGIQRMLHDLKPVMHLLTDTNLSAELAAWLNILPELDPFPTDPERLGVVSARPTDRNGRLLLTMSDGTSALIEPDLTHEQIAGRYRLDRVVTMPAIDFCAGIHLDGPLAGQTGYATNELGSRTRFYLPPQPGGPTGFYEVTRLATQDKPAEMRFVGFTSSDGELPQPE
ncbi:hypothetical protein AB0H83_39580 [Dactylosporangium sp. NPDC050688]|uniref:hypothetical protein n=1 Tax=Dactylosporangium sp. NPDC050688 TaxID=3157217 RepID=UPI0033E5D70B